MAYMHHLLARGAENIFGVLMLECYRRVPAAANGAGGAGRSVSWLSE